jgi:prepilin-type N-terminal cleavage/methylation domain-containing protein
MNGRNQKRGFTILELLVAAVVTLVLAGIMLSVSVGALELWRKSQGNFTTATEAMVALDYLERDLQSALYREDGGTWLAVAVGNSLGALANRGWLLVDAVRYKPATMESLRLLPEPDANSQRQIRDARFGMTGAWLRLVAPTAESANELALPRVIAYQIARRPVRGAIDAINPAVARYTLYRSAITNLNTFNLGYDVVAGVYGSTGNNPGVQRAASTVANPNSLDVLASNVIDFGIWLYVRQPDGTLRVIFPINAGDQSHEVIGQPGLPDEQLMPDVADVMVRVLSEDGAALIGAIETGLSSRPPEHATDGVWWWAVAEAHSQVWTRRIEIKGGIR